MAAIKASAIEALEEASHVLLELSRKLSGEEIEKDRVSGGRSRELSALTQVEQIEPFLCRIAEREFTNRRKRLVQFDEDLFGEAAWDIMLDAFITRAKGERASVKVSCLAASVPTTTALRYIKLLVARGVLEEQPSASDKRVKWIRLSDDHYLRLATYLNYIAVTEADFAATRARDSEYLVKQP